MSDLQLLFLILLLIYLSECCFWVRRGSVVLRPRGSGGYSIAYPSPLLGNEHGGLVFLNPFPPFRGAFICRFQPFSLTETTVCSLPAQSLDPAGQAVREAICIPFDAIEKIAESDGNILINGKPFAGAGEEHVAAYYAKTLTRIWKKPLQKRKAAIDAAIRWSTDAGAIRDRLDQHRELSGTLRLLCHLLFAWLFIVPVVAIQMSWILPYWPIFLLLMVACIAAIASLFYSAHKRLLPSANIRRWKSFAIILLTPTAAVRAFDALSRDVLRLYDPLACAAVICEASAFQTFARRVLQDLRHPFPVSDESGAWMIKQAAANTLLGHIESVVAGAGVSVTELAAPPALQDPSCVSYCPRCDVQYTTLTGACEDCGGIVLVPLVPEKAVG